jgi:hypothetical protein
MTYGRMQVKAREMKSPCGLVATTSAIDASINLLIHLDISHCIDKPL